MDQTELFQVEVVEFAPTIWGDDFDLERLSLPDEEEKE
jgi:hypothetical protein